MLVRDLEYMEAASSTEIEGGFARAFARAGKSTAAGNNFAETEDLSIANSSQALFEFGGPGGPIYARFSADGAASSYSQSS